MNYMNYGAPATTPPWGSGSPASNQPSFTTAVDPYTPSYQQYGQGAPAQQQHVASNAYTPEPQQMASILPFQTPQRSTQGDGMMHATVMPNTPNMWGGGNPFTVNPTVGNALLSQEYEQGLVPSGASTQAAMPTSVVQSTPQPQVQQYQQGQVSTNTGSQAGNTSNVAAGTVQSVASNAISQPAAEPAPTPTPAPQYHAPTPAPAPPQQQVADNAYNPTAQTQTVADNAYNPTAQTQQVADNAYNPTAQTQQVADNAYNPTAQTQTVADNAYNPTAQTQTVADNAYNPTAQTQEVADNAYNPTTQTQQVSDNAYNPTTQTQTVADNAINPTINLGGDQTQEVADNAYNPTTQTQQVADNAYNPTTQTQQVADNAYDPFAADTSGQPVVDPNATQVVADNAYNPTATAIQTQEVANNAYDPTAQTQQTQQVASNAYDPTATVDNSAAANAYAQQQQQNFNQQQGTGEGTPGIDPLIDPKRYGESTALAMDPILDYTARLEEPLINELESNLGTPNYNFTEAGNNSLLNSLERQYRYDGAGALGKTALTQDPNDLQSALLNNANRIDDANPYDTRRDDIIGGKDSEVDRMYDKEFERIQNQFAVNNNLGSPAYTQALQDMNDQKAQAKLGIRSEFGQTAAAQDESMASGRLADVTGAIGTSRSGQISEEAIQANRRAGAQATGGYMGTTEFDQDLRGSALEEGVRRGRAHDVGQGLERERGHVDRQMGYQQQLQQQANDDYYRNLKAEEDAMYRPFQYQDAGLALGGGALASPGTDMSTAMQGYGSAASGYGQYGANKANEIATHFQSLMDNLYRKPGE